MRISLRTINPVRMTRFSSLKWVILTLFSILFMYIVYQWFSSKAETFRCDSTTMNRGLLHETSISAQKQQSSPGSPFSTSVDVMKSWLVSIYPDLGQYAEKVVEHGYRQPEEIIKLNDTKRNKLLRAVGMNHDLHIQLFNQAIDTHSAPSNMPSSAYTNLHKANAACKDVNTSPLGSYKICVTADEDEANNDCTYVPIRVGDMVWARYNETNWEEARVVAVFNSGQLPTVPLVSNDTNRWLQKHKTFFNITNSDKVDKLDITYKQPFLKNEKHATQSSSRNPQGYSYELDEVDYDTVNSVTLHIQFVKFPNKPPYDTIERKKQTQRDPLKLKYDLRVEARNVRRYPPQSVIDDAMLQCIKSNTSGEYVTIGCKPKYPISEHSKHVFESICSETCQDVNQLKDSESTGNISNVYKKDSNTLSQSMLTHVLNECDPSSGYRKAKQSCDVKMALQETVASDGTGRIVPNACPCASSTLNAAEVQTFLDMYKPREFKLGSRCFPEETPANADQSTTTCDAIYDVPCGTRTKQTANGEDFCERTTTTKHQCKWYDRSEQITKNSDRLDSPTMTGCYDADDCLFSETEDSCNPNKCKWKAEWNQCVPNTSCVTDKPVTIDEYNQLIQKNEYQKIQQRQQQSERIENENTREDKLLEKMNTTSFLLDNIVKQL